MAKVGRVQYFDPYYLYTDTFETSELLQHEAFGYVQERGEWIELSFTRSFGIFGSSPGRGLLLPKSALKSQVERGLAPEGYADGDLLEVTWRDISHSNRVGAERGSFMKTRGRLCGTRGKCLVLGDPKTIRIKPLPSKPHPEKDPRFYVIPFSLIEKITKASAI